MLKGILHTFVRNSVFSNLLMLLIVVAGLAGATQMIREVLPSFAIESIRVSIPYPGAGPEEVEEGITLKIEDAIEGIQGIKDYSTVSAEGMATAVIDVDPDYDLQVVKDRVADQINAITTFPDDAENPSISELIIRRDTMYLAVAGDIPERQLKELADEIRRDLMMLPEVSDVELRSTRDYEISIEISEEKLRRYGLTFDDVSNAVAGSSLNLPGGDLRSDREEMTLRTLGRKYTGKEYGDIVLIKDQDGTSILMRDVAEIKDGFIEDITSTRFNGKPSATVAIYNSDSEDALYIAEAVESYVAKKNEALPETVKVHIWLDATNFITERIQLLLKNGIMGLALVFLMLWFFLDTRLAFWVSLGIPISLSGAFFLMYVVGETINMISLFAMLMVLGIIVDDAIVVGESIYVHRRMGKGPIQAAIDGTAEVAMPVFCAVITTCIAFAPLLFVDGIMGKFIKVIPTVVICALLVSLIEGLLVLPAHLNHLPAFDKKGNPAIPKIKIFGFKTIMIWMATKFRPKVTGLIEYIIHKVYDPFLRICLHWRYTVFACAIAVLMLTMGLVQGGFVKAIFFPETDTSFILGQVEFPEGTPIDVTRQAVLKMESALEEINQTTETISNKDLIVGSEANIGLQIGMDSGRSGTIGSHVGEIRVELLGAEKRGVPFQEILKKWEENTGPIAGSLSVTFQEVQGGPPGLPIEIWFTGNDLDTLRAAADEAKERLSEKDGVYQIQDDFRPGKREIRTTLKPEAESLGLTNAMLARQIRQGFYGEEVLRVQRDREEVKVWVRYPIDERRSLADIDKVRIRTAEGDEVPLYTVADVEIDNGFTTINRKNGQRLIRVTADVFSDTANANEILEDLEEDYLSKVSTLYPGVEASIDGEQAENQESLDSLKVGFPMAVLGIYLVIATLFRSYLQPIIILFTVPFGIIGAVVGHMVMGFEISMMSMFGMVALTGVVVNDAIVSIEAINDRLAQGMAFFESVAQGGVRRFRAILLTTATTAGGLLPLMTEKSLQAQFLIPMALTIAAGIMFATLLTLIVIPCLFYILNDIRCAVYYLIHGKVAKREKLEPATKRNVSDDEFFTRMTGVKIPKPQEVN